MTLTLTLTELLAIMLLSAALASTEAVRLSLLFTAYVAKKLGVKPSQVRAMDAATDGDPETTAEEAESAG